ncbi:MAG: hypothetical protein AAB676_11700 [Verrucomicrobiota bacterium]
MRDGESPEIVVIVKPGPLVLAGYGAFFCLTQFHQFAIAWLHRRCDSVRYDPAIDSAGLVRVASRRDRQPFHTVTRAMYLWRCGTAVSGAHNGKDFAHPACSPA